MSGGNGCRTLSGLRWVPLSETEEVRERLFPNWKMEVVTTDDMRDVLQDALDTAKDGKNADVLRGLLAQLDSGRLVLRLRNIETK